MLRAAVFAAVCVLLAALGHVLMSGSRVTWWVLTAGAAATGAVGWCLAGRERGLPLIVPFVVLDGPGTAEEVRRSIQVHPVRRPGGRQLTAFSGSRSRASGLAP
ncbi:hypothetical protein AQJ91_30870 [Streptomyces dysideae]|uniref:Uncharacterized protein n=1 Tax=Streptomyces dysideae TaxID=909626 RepID=A0A101UUT6_9ACTN|nr:hypothetical protein AQJ91_30870 [Streptomyces dysideae]